MRVAIFGGTFNPFHIGHAMLCESLLRDEHYERVLIIPTSTPPHKKVSGNITALQRLQMVSAFCAADGSGRLVADDCEIERGGVSYSYDTIVQVLARYEKENAKCESLDGKLGFVIGEETASQFEKWHEAKKIAQLCNILIARRHPEISFVDTSGFENTPTATYIRDDECDSRNIDKTFPFPHRMLENVLLPLSSTQIRARIKQGLAYRYLIPQSVYEYIEKWGLYKS